MPPEAVCPRCGRSHTAEEYTADRFCRGCGSHLDPPRMPVEPGQWRSLFPYEPYPQQADFMADAERVVGGGGVLVAEACNGFGKTVSALSALLPLRAPIVYATRTHDQVRQILTEAERINKHAGRAFTAVNLASRDHLCLNPDCRALTGRDAQELCGMLRKDDECPWKSEPEELPGLPAILTPDQLTAAGRRHRLCPYFLARRAAKTRDLVVAPYPYIFDPRIRMMTGLDLEGRLLVLDEGHNIDQVAQDTFTDTLTDRGLASAGDELKLAGMSRAPMRKLQDLLAQEVAEEPRLVKGEDAQEALEKALGADLSTFLEHHAPAVDVVRERKQKAGEPAISALSGVLTFMELLLESRKDRFAALWTRSSYGANSLEYRCLDASLAVRPVVDSAAGTLIMSGTLSPLDLFAEVLGLQGVELRSYPSVQRSSNIRMTIDPRVGTAYRDRTPSMLRRIGETVAEALPGVPNGALVFFTQRGLLERCLDEWGSAGILRTEGGKPVLGGKPLFREGFDARSNAEQVARFKAAAVTLRGAVLLCVFRGRNSEGSNFPDDQCRGIFLVGVPYANYSDPLVRAQMAFYDRRRMGLGNRWYTMDAFRAANQALGRGIRSRDDWCHYWLLDKRFAENQPLISAWAKGPGPTIAGENS